MQPLNLFYEQSPKRDSWFPYDRYLRRLNRYAKRGVAPAGQMRVFLNLCKGLDQIGVPYRKNDYKYIQQHPEELACILGKENVLNKLPWKNPILYGPNVYDHPSEDPDLLERLPIKNILIASEWFRQMCEPAWGEVMVMWRGGIDTDLWTPGTSNNKPIDILLYDKLKTNDESHRRDLLIPIREALQRRGLKTVVLQYGYYWETQFRALLKKSKALIFLSEHETQGLARLQAHSADVPVLAWDLEGFWKNPAYYPHKVRFSPVSSVPDWDERCGVKFKGIDDFHERLEEFLEALGNKRFAPREYMLQNFTLDKCAREYVRIADQLR